MVIDPEMVRAGLKDVAGQAGPLDLSTSDLGRRIRRRRQRAAGVLVGCAAITAIAAGGFSWIGGANGRDAATAPYTSPAAVPPNMRAISYHGVEVMVPAGWPTNATRCGTAVRDTVVMPVVATPACSVKPTAFDVVEVSDARHQTPEFVPGARRVSFFGHPGLTGERRLPDGRTEVGLSVPDLDVSVVAQTSRPDLARRLIASIRLARPADSLRCVDPVPALQPQLSRKAAEQLAPTGFSSAVVCVYDNLRSAGSTRLTTADAAMLAQRLNALQPGLQNRGPVNKPPKKPYPQPCTPADQVAFHSGYLLRLSYSDGQTVEVVVRVNGCRELGANNGARTGRLTNALVDSLGKLTGYPMAATPLEDLTPR